LKEKVYKATVCRDGGWLVAQVSGLRAFDGGKGGVVTQGRDLDELAFMVRDAIELLTDTSNFSIQLLLPADLRAGAVRRKTTKKARRRAA
jgi:hypothetical protein